MSECLFFSEISKNTFYDRTLLVAASVFFNNLIPFEKINIAEVLILGLNVMDANDNSLYQFRKYF